MDVYNRLPSELQTKIQKHAAGAENLGSRKLPCHYCEHKAIIIYEDSQGHIGVKCRKCGKEGVYNVRLRRRAAISSYYS